MPDQTDITAKIRRMAATLLNVKPAELDNRDLREAGADSVDVVTLIMQVENEFGVSIADLEAEGANSVPEIAALVAKKMGVPNG